MRNGAFEVRIFDAPRNDRIEARPIQLRFRLWRFNLVHKSVE
jgi:hypothetical protein